MSRILVAFASTHGQTRKIGDVIAAELRAAGHVVELAAALAGPPPPVQDYDVVVLGSRIRYSRHAPEIVRYITANRAELDTIPSYFFSVSMTAAGSQSHDPAGYLERLFTATRWRPRGAVAFGGGLAYRQYGPVLRVVMKLFSRMGGHPTDARRDHDCTDWSQVRRFAARIAADLGSPTARDAPPDLLAPRSARP